MAPIRTEAEGPPIRPVLEIDRALRLHEDERARAQHMRQRAGIVLRVGRDLGEGDVAGLSDEAPERGVRYRRRIDPETADLDAMGRFFLGIMVIRAHGELAARNEDHLTSGLGLRDARPLDLARDTHAKPLFMEQPW